MTAASFPWRQLGEILVRDGLLTQSELEQALREQRRSGRLLGQILVQHGHVSSFALARALSAQHGVVLQETRRVKPAPGAPLPGVPETWQIGRAHV